VTDKNIIVDKVLLRKELSKIDTNHDGVIDIIMNILEQNCITNVVSTSTRKIISNKNGFDIITLGDIQ
jgi:hypothetical protein